MIMYTNTRMTMLWFKLKCNTFRSSSITPTFVLIISVVELHSFLSRSAVTVKAISLTARSHCLSCSPRWRRTSTRTSRAPSSSASSSWPTEWRQTWLEFSKGTKIGSLLTTIEESSVLRGQLGYTQLLDSASSQTNLLSLAYLMPLTNGKSKFSCLIFFTKSEFFNLV